MCYFRLLFFLFLNIGFIRFIGFGVIEEGGGKCITVLLSLNYFRYGFVRLVFYSSWTGFGSVRFGEGK